jgi:hypothetical protein
MRPIDNRESSVQRTARKRRSFGICVAILVASGCGASLSGCTANRAVHPRSAEQRPRSAEQRRELDATRAAVREHEFPTDVSSVGFGLASFEFCGVVGTWERHASEQAHSMRAKSGDKLGFLLRRNGEREQTLYVVSTDSELLFLPDFIIYSSPPSAGAK